MTATSTHPVSEAIVPSVMLIKGLFNNMLDGVTPEMFAKRPDGVAANHPGYIFGHTAFYADKLLTGLGVGSSSFSEGDAARYGMDVDVVDSADGDQYLSMDESVRIFNEVFDRVISGLPGVEAERLDASAAGTSFEGLMSSMGGVANFVFVAHPMMHAGQLSTWRRCMGLGPAALR